MYKTIKMCHLLLHITTANTQSTFHSRHHNQTPPHLTATTSSLGSCPDSIKGVCMLPMLGDSEVMELQSDLMTCMDSATFSFQICVWC